MLIQIIKIQKNIPYKKLPRKFTIKSGENALFLFFINQGLHS